MKKKTILNIVEWIIDHWAELMIAAFSIFVLSSEAYSYFPFAPATEDRTTLYTSWPFLDTLCESGTQQTCKDTLLTVKSSWLYKIALFSFLSLAFYKKHKKEQQLKERVKLYETLFGLNNESPEEEINAILKFICDKYLSFTNSHRVSVYKLDSNIEQFLRIGRHCREPVLQKGGAKEFSKNKGVIGKTWLSENGAYSVESLPDRKKNLDLYIQRMEKEGIHISNEELKSKRMFSRSYYCFRVLDADNSKHTAIIVFESTNLKGFRDKKLKKVLESNEGKLLQKTICERPTTSFANSELGV